MGRDSAVYRMTFAIVLLACTAFCGEDKPEEKFDLNVKDQSLESVLKILREKSGYALFAADPKEDDTKITLELKQSAWRTALEKLAVENGFTVLSPSAWGKLMLLDREKKFSLTFANEDIRDVLNTWAVHSGRNIILLDDVKGNVTVRIDNLSASEAIGRIREACNFEFLDGPFGTVIAAGNEGVKKIHAARAAQSAYVMGSKPQPDPNTDKVVSLTIEKKGVQTILEKLHAQAEFEEIGNWERTKATFELKDVGARGAIEFVGRRFGIGIDFLRPGPPQICFGRGVERVSFIFNNADIRDVINTIAIQADTNIVLLPEVKGNVSARMENVPWETALRMIVNTQGYVMVREPDNLCLIGSPERFAELATPVAQGRFITVTYMNASLADVVADIAAKAHAEIKFAEDRPKKWVVTGHFQNLHWKSALRAVLLSLDLELAEQKDGTFLIQTPTAKFNLIKPK